MKNLKTPILYLQWILIGFSLIALIMISAEGMGLAWELSSAGFQKYLSLYEPYSVLFTATFIVLTSNLAIERLGLMNDANKNSFKASNRTIWQQTVLEFLTEGKEDNPQMVKEFRKQLLQLHDHLYDLGYKFQNNIETAQFFDKFFKNKVQYFEQMNTRFLGNGYYPIDESSFTWDYFRYMVAAMVNFDDCYDRFYIDLKELYMTEVKAFNKNHVNKSLYLVGLELSRNKGVV